ncbi:MAG TPA: YkgJ family cysteine cluster protein [Steroidobacteraceae bacterium]|nr:YkgJ family cysteine cluster protein [Steroidobacteraceae bacterium]
MSVATDMHSVSHIDAGNFGTWLMQAREALRSNTGMNVPCGDCVGCCTSGYSILLRPHDAALDMVPVKFLSSVPGMRYPHAKMNPLANGHCPMFENGRCSIYSSRPQTCLDYDCRVFTAAGIDAGASRSVINQRIKAWNFSYASVQEHSAHRAIQAAAAFISKHAHRFPANWNTTAPSAIAVLAIKVYELFVDENFDPQNEATAVTRVMDAVRAFDATIHPA